MKTLDKYLNEDQHFKISVGRGSNKKTISTKSPMRAKILTYIETTKPNLQEFTTWSADNNISNNWLSANKTLVYLSTKDACYKLTALGTQVLKWLNKYADIKNKMRDDLYKEIKQELTADAIEKSKFSIFENKTEDEYAQDLSNEIINTIWEDE